MNHHGRPSVELGSFIVGEIPPPLEYQFLDADGVPIDLTGFVVATFQWSDYVQGQFVNPVVGVATVTTPLLGLVTHIWNGDEFSTPGSKVGMFFVNDGTTQYASILITWQVCLGVGFAPAL